jgi:protein subunit release factor A
MDWCREEDLLLTNTLREYLQYARPGLGDKLRTYNFPQSRITDHRINKSWHNLEDILDGGLEPIIASLSRANLGLDDASLAA